MGEYINKYANSAAVQSAVDGGELIKPYVALDESTGMIDWNSKKADYSKIPLTFEFSTDGVIYWMGSNGKTIEYSKNGGEWTSITSTTAGSLIEVVSGDIFQFRGDNTTYNMDGFKMCRGQFKVYGNIMSTVNSTNFSDLVSLSGTRNFSAFFYSCTGLTDASELILPATALTNYCYNEMFSRCSGLTATPELPATTLASYCYQQMFYNCTSLTTAPQLPATTLAPHSYHGMFYNCTNLTTAPELPATTLAQSCYESMFGYCSNLTTAPELPAASVGQYSYADMFKYCSRLNYIKSLATVYNASTYNSWVQGVASSGTFVTPSSTNWSTGISGIPEGWTRVDA